jgi:alkylation response protein AidB-like acyl-CoA dehydrogenase
MEEHVYPHEEALNREDDAAQELLAALRARAKAAGLWAPHLPPEAGGSGRGFLAYAHLNEEIGRVPWAQYVFNCQAPDAGNGEILHLFGTDEQKERWLAPLVDGEARSFFSMTEPDVSGADPTGLRTTAVLADGEWVIDGRKWFSSGAEGAAFGIVMAVTEPDAEPRRRMSQIVVPADAYGVTIRAELAERAGRTVAPGALYTSLERLETKGLITSRMSDPTPQRGGRAKRHVAVTAAGRKALTRAVQAYVRLLDGLDLARGARV